MDAGDEEDSEVSDIVALLEAIESSDEPVASEPRRRGRPPKSSVKKPATRKKRVSPASSKKGKRKLNVQFNGVLFSRDSPRGQICFTVADQVDDQALESEKLLQGETVIGW